MKDAYYFSHDSNAHKDPKILRLRAKHGWAGYGIFWAIIETLREQEGYKWESNDKHLLSYSFGNGDGEINEVIDTCLEIGLLVLNDDGYIHSESLTKRMKKKEEVSEKRRQAGKKGGSSNTKANAKQTESNKRKEKESKEKKKESKLNKKEKIEAYTTNPILIETLNDFVEMRERIKAPLNTDRAFTLVFNRLDDLSKNNDETKIKILEQSILNNWKGVFELKGSTKQQESNSLTDKQALLEKLREEEGYD